ncbi:DNA polymerase III subunit beta [Ensifer sp. PDNC004]|uniref:DNA polymerase III subunit beta n=1 Tax=Ensifer sp. PDNC004 TaxID=2811423 RepID=UPI001962F330|nr:DNA polymerase III subunit beta [Ensifer sp. PDNC004]QRY68170.1 DNA polymerase III subunit beta [Ensifer sp. PDNC004]
MAEIWFTIHRSNLHQALARVMGAIDKSSTIPILSHVLLDPLAEGVLLRGSNLSLQIDAECEAISIREPIPFAIPADKFKAILANLPENAEVSFGPGRSKDSIAISAGSSRHSIPFLPAQDFPLIPIKVELNWTEISGKPLAAALDKATFPLKKTDDRPWITGYCLHPEKGGDGMVVATTDGLSLARVVAATGGCPALPSQHAAYPQVILPQRAAESVRKLLDNAAHGVLIAATDFILAVKFDGVTITAKLIDGTYPEYEQVIPSPGDNSIGVKMDALSASIKRVCVVIDDAAVDALYLRPRAGRINVDIVGRDGGAAHDSLAGEIEAPEDLEICLNGEQLSKMLASITSPEISLHPIMQSERVLVRPVGSPGETYVLSTMRPRYSAMERAE